MRPLTPRERQIVSLIAEGLNCDEIAASLNITAMTVRKHRSNITQKLGFSTTVQLVAYAMDIVSPSVSQSFFDRPFDTWDPRAGGVAPCRCRLDQQTNRSKTKH
jgi:DNA-binding CsgD family transcriptional regulator